MAAVNAFMAIENNAKGIVIMRPGIVGLRHYSLAVIPRHDRPPKRSNVLQTALAPNLIDGETMRLKGAKMREVIKTGKDIVLGLLVGGDNPDFRLTPDGANKMIMGVMEFCKANDAELLVTTSRRTPKEAEAMLKARLEIGRASCRERV